MTLLDDAPVHHAPVAVLPDATGMLAAAPVGATLVLLALPADPVLADRAERTVRRETRAEDRSLRLSATELAVVLAVPEADRDAVADRLLSVVERSTGLTAAAGVCVLTGRTDPLGLARAGLAVAWACGGSRAVRHP
ncbi:hypothetical protein [Modestobacter sp. Leaf380]|uniref:hypothetical protein n=1 Tax=Modestobacter sp. Leaf380 TaxID=1736356 RepID=UPI0006FACDDC|nr:hypothetical protein [Modestobacter sp. Leaf380]KQS68861.1 hypothetical protein ASG41_08130 [Modestobacter sp. Leaf380]